MPLRGEYLGMTLTIDDVDEENREFFRYCHAGDFRLQRGRKSGLLRYPPTTACPWTSDRESDWVSVEGKGIVHTYTEVRHPIQPAFRDLVPYLILLVDLDTQKGEPTEHEALRVAGNLVTPGRGVRPAGDDRAGRHRDAGADGLRRGVRGDVDPALDHRRGGGAARPALALPPTPEPSAAARCLRAFDARNGIGAFLGNAGVSLTSLTSAYPQGRNAWVAVASPASRGRPAAPERRSRALAGPARGCGAGR